MEELEDSSEFAIKITWDVMEELQEKSPYLWIGWNGIVPMIYFPITEGDL